MPARLKELGGVERKIYDVLVHQAAKARPDALIDYTTLEDATGWPRDQMGPPLKRLVEWCRKHGFPALSALAVQHDMRIPGKLYYPVAHGGKTLENDPRGAIDDWTREVDAVLGAAAQYPT
jgi:hypothetical protein